MEERGELAVAAAPGSSSSGLGVGPVGGAMEAGQGSAALAGIQEEPGGRRDASGPETDADAPPKKRVRLQEGEAGKLEERLYSVLCCTVCLDLPKASVYQVIKTTDALETYFTSTTHASILQVCRDNSINGTTKIEASYQPRLFLERNRV